VLHEKISIKLYRFVVAAYHIPLDFREEHMFRSIKYASILVFLFLSVNSYGEATTQMSRQECLASKNTEIIANCIEAGVYDPCDDAGGKWGLSQCAQANSLVASRRIERALKTIQKQSLSSGIYENFKFVEWSQKNFELYRDQYCAFKGAADEKSQFLNGEMSGFCIRRLNEERAKDLESMLK
jgi:hypothetical protein